MKIPTAHSADSLERFLRYMQKAPVPVAMTRTYLKESGFKSGNDPELRHIFRLLGFLDDNFRPVDQWRQYKEDGEIVLQEAIYKCYADVFKLFPNAPLAQSSELEVWFRPPLTGETRSAIDRAIRTFRKLCQFANITPDNRIKNGQVEAIQPSAHLQIATQRNLKNLPLILNVPAFSDKTDYIRYFEALKEVFYE